MKRLGLVLAFVLLSMSTGNAQQEHDVELSVNSGFVFPASPMTFSNYWNMQYGGGLRAGIPLSASVSLVGSFEYYRFTLNENGIAKGFDTNYMRDIWIFKNVEMNPSADASSVTTASVNLRIAPSTLSGVLSPYFIGGVGLMRFSLSEITLQTMSVLSVEGSDIPIAAQQTVTGGTVSSLFFQFGAGFEIRMSELLDVFVEARYASGRDKGRGATYVPLTAGVKIRL